IQTELCSMSLSEFAHVDHEIPEDTVWMCLVDLLKALDHLHSRDLIHLDIKPDNILISPDNLCKLGDFGLVCEVKKARSYFHMINMGDGRYVANEVLQNGVYTTAADIFSLGMTILELALDFSDRRKDWLM